ncbi:MAG: exodeoxyribonuclease VII large subunit [Spirochaetaceae bacterium]|jgi:exodeoxyribonuclease VII large subunit|nr:exodeoxyribonuclease VII large subunit [Spirochaetaceae bacterium]
MGGTKYSVTELTELIRQRLEGGFPDIVVEGELSNCRPSSTGHLYFTLKDAGAAISAVMFRGSQRSLTFEPRDGMLVRAAGHISVYAQRGTYQIIAEALEQAGTGDILAMLEKRKRLLAEAGLFDEARKRPLPRLPGVAGVISSPTGAAVRDILAVLARRAPGMRVIILPCPVQGAEAAPAIARRIEQANGWSLADVLIVGRGGGSLEDLLPFSEEAVVRAVAASRIPVVSAVGHEIDWALSDFAADLRAPTPSAAAELVSAEWNEIPGVVETMCSGLERSIRDRLERVRMALALFSLRDMEFRFRGILQPRFLRFDDAREDLVAAIQERLRDAHTRVELAFTGLDASNPMTVLERGFSLVIHEKTGKVVRSAGEVAPGDMLEIFPLVGRIRARTGEIEAGMGIARPGQP